MKRNYKLEKRWHNIAVNTLMVLVSLIVALILLEIVLRLFGFRPHHPIETLFKKNSELGYSLTSSASQVMETSEARYLVTIMNGRRNIPDQLVVPGDAKTSVYAVGDSFCFGQGVDDKNVWINILAESVGSSHKLYFYNLGVPGYNPEQYHLMIEKLPRDLGQAVVIYLFFMGNDITGSTLRDLQQNVSKIELQHFPNSFKLLRWFSEQSAVVWSICTVAVVYQAQHEKVGSFKSKTDFENFMREYPNWYNTVALVSDSLKTIERRGGKTLLVLIPFGKQYSNQEGESVGRYIGNFFSSEIRKRVENVTILDLSQHMHFGHQLLFRGYGHFNIRGNQWMAELIEPMLIHTLTERTPLSNDRQAEQD